MAESTTKLTIQAQTKGIAEATKEAAKLSESVGGVAKKAKGSSSGIKAVMKELRDQLKQSTKDADALSAAFIAQSKQLKSLQKQYEGVAGAVKKTRKERKDDQKEARAADAQAQAAPPPPPTTISGRIRQFFGRGSGGGGHAGGPAGGPSSPYGPAGQSRGAFGQGFLQGVLPEAFIQRGPGMLAQAGGALAGRAVRGVAGAAGTLLSSPLSGSEAAVEALGKIPFAGALAGGLRMSLSAAQGEAGAQRSLGSLMPYMRAPTSRDGAGATLASMRAATTAAGIQFGGLNRNETAAQIGQMAASGGGYANQYSISSQRQALAAAQGFGIDTGTSGVLARGDQLRATTGGQSTGTLTKAIADGLSMSLEGSELTRYVQGIAGQVEGFATSGIKVDEASQGSIGRFMQGTGGYSGIRAAALSGGITSTMSQVADSGPQNAGQFALLQAAGYDPSDPESFYKAQERIDSAAPNDRARIFAKARKSAMSGLQGLGKYAKGGATREILGQMGAQLRIGEAIKEGQSGGGNMGAAIKGGSTEGVGAIIEAVGTTNTFDSSRMTGQMANQDSKTGAAYLPSMMKMDAQARITLNSLSNVGSKFVDLASRIQAFGADLTSQATNALGITSTDAQTPQ